ncbi:MAG: hypothetical protein WA687_14585 [Solirubrobacterales bacterium]
MIRNLKALGLALVAMLALSAVAASAASAQQGKLTADGPVTLTATETGTPINDNFFRNNTGTKVTCPGSTYTGHKYNVTPHGLIASGETTATVTPKYATHCTAHIPILGTRPATVTMNSCDYVFHIGNTTPGGNGTYGVSADLVCPGTGPQIHIYKNNPASHTTPEQICTITVTPATDITGPHLTSTGGVADDIDLDGIFTGIHETHEGSLCGTGTTNNAELRVDITIKGQTGGGVNTPVTITDA